MTTQPAVPRRPACLPGGITGYPGQLSRSAGDVGFVAHADDPVRRPRGADHRVVSGNGADMAGQRDDAVPGFRFHIAAAGERCRFPESGGTRPAGQVSYEL
jgi:hypothetical protein